MFESYYYFTESQIGRPVELLVFHIKAQAARKTLIIPAESTQTQRSVDLGIKTEVCSVEDALKAYRVLVYG